jgi:hypothetical protein
MGQYLNLYRLSPEWAVEMLSGRQGRGDLTEGNAASPIYDHGSPMNGTGASQTSSSIDSVDIRRAPDTLDWERHKLYVGRFHHSVADMLTGSFHGGHAKAPTFDVECDETDDPLDWAVFGRRICGWQIDLPLRYSNPSDLPPIIVALSERTNDHLRANLYRVAERYSHPRQRSGRGYAPGEADDRLDDFLPHLLPNLCTFFRRAEQAGEFVVHHIG